MSNINFLIKPEYIQKSMKKDIFMNKCYNVLNDLAEEAKEEGLEFSSAIWFSQASKEFDEFVETLEQDIEVKEEDRVEAYLCSVTSASDEDLYRSLLLSKFLIDAVIDEIDESLEGLEEDNQISDEEEVE